MSLLGSIFGGEKKEEEEEKKKKKEGSSGDLFNNSASLPAKPQHKAPPAKPKRTSKRKADSTETIIEERGEGGDGREGGLQKKKKKRKAPKTDKKNDGNGTVEKEEEEKEEKSPKTSIRMNTDARTIFVGNLPLSTTRKSLASMFKSCGKVESSRLRSIPTTGIKISQDRAGDQAFVKKVCANLRRIDASAKSTAQGYVVFHDAASVEQALALNNTELIPGSRIRVDRADATRDAARSVFVGNLPYTADEATLRAHFAEGCGLEETDVENVRIVRDRETMQCKGFGYVLFTQKDMVMTALKRMHESNYMKRSLRVTVCGKRFKGRRGAIQEEAPSKRRMRPQDPNGALKRILEREQSVEGQKEKRKRGQKKSGTAKHGPPGLTRRAALEAKVEKRVKKLKKRAAKGMGKAKIR